MQFRIADTFTDSLAKLTNEEQKAVKTTAFDLQLNPANPGMSFHKLDRAKDKHFWSVRVSRDLRIIVHSTESSLLLCYVDHHDKAYQWAERRKLEIHPKTGAAQLVEIRETVQEITVPVYVEQPERLADKPKLFAAVADETLLGYGVPEEWLPDIRAADEDSLLDLADHLPSEAAEALLELATGGRPQTVVPTPGIDPFEHPDAQRRFRLMTDADELAAALEYPWEKWTVFLHPAQRQLVERDYNGPARISGSAGTGKTIVALHRAVFLARRQPDARILLSTFSDTLANALRNKLRILISKEPRLGERIEVHALDAIGERLYEAAFGSFALADEQSLRRIFTEVKGGIAGFGYSEKFLLDEWTNVVDAWQLNDWEAYRDVKRLGRKTRLGEQQRLQLWGFFEQVQKKLSQRGLTTRSTLFTCLAGRLRERPHPPFDFAVIDEAQDINVSQLHFLAALGEGRPNSLFFAGDLGQRIFQTPFSWRALGVDIRGRSHTLRVNYRTSHQIRRQADRLLGPEVSDVDGNIEDRRGTVSVFNGPEPLIQVCDSKSQEVDVVASWLEAREGEGLQPHEIGLFVRSGNEVRRATSAAEKADVDFNVLDEQMKTASGAMTISTMHLAKGMEFRAVAIMACDDEVIPSQERIETVADASDLEEVYATERHLLYVACTRARETLLVTAVDPGSEFLSDLRGL
ncbi:3'-5' exonuclease [Acidihalobacter ferrooxydans]|uniref:DNA 3'-5' helicase n=1 Tax=Acidihalobacter ferrooxydans TaxID=1765967 RepID=A0A1P8UIY3_9GAMM|nr:3'-5' exonuclease [Acidihalobacter ferrooxydans]APZ43777.1 DNA helicase [Acidihalobacter ferrooxydans]